MPSRLLALPAALVLSLSLAGCGDDTGQDSGSGPTTDCTYPSGGQAAAKDVDPPSSEAPESGETEVTLATSEGDITLTLDQAAAPCTVHSFVSLAEQGYFDDTACHRLVTQGIYVLQCGDPSGTGMQGPGYSFADELSGRESYPTGTVAMANAGSDTNGSQFFLVYEDSPLPPDYTVFGRMDDAGVDVVRRIAQAGAQGGAADGPPATEVTIQSATRE